MDDGQRFLLRFVVTMPITFSKVAATAYITIVANEISTFFASGAEKHTPMMQHYMRGKLRHIVQGLLERSGDQLLAVAPAK